MCGMVCVVHMLYGVCVGGVCVVHMLCSVYGSMFGLCVVRML